MTQLEQTVIIISHKITIKKKITFLEFPDGPAVRTLHFHCRGHNRFCPWSGTKIQQATQEKKRRELLRVPLRSQGYCGAGTRFKKKQGPEFMMINRLFSPKKIHS